VLSKEDVLLFQDKFVLVEHGNEGQYAKGIIKQVTENSIILDCYGRSIVISLEVINKIKEMKFQTGGGGNHE
jgi:hypothetical protein